MTYQEHDDLSDTIRQFHINEDIEIADRFKFLVTQLPEELIQWERWFKPVYLNSSWKNHYKNEVSVKRIWPLSEKLIHYALTPVAFYSSFHGIELLLNKPPKERFKNDSFENNSAKINFQIEGDTILLSIDDFVFFMDGTIALENKKAMALWIIAVLEFFPDLIPNYHITKQNDTFIAKHVKETHKKSHEIKIHQIPPKNHTTALTYQEIIDRQKNYIPYKPPVFSTILENCGMFFYTVWLMLYFAYIFITMPFFIVYGKITYAIGKWFWTIKGKRNDF